MKMCITVTTALLVVGLLGPALAHEGASGIIKERMDVMKGIRNDMKPLRSMVRGRTDYDQARFLARVQSIKSVSGDITSLFPEGSLDWPSEALPAIWDNWSDFTEQSRSFHQRVIELESAVQGNDMSQIKSSFRAVAGTCKTCHDDYQKD